MSEESVFDKLTKEFLRQLEDYNDVLRDEIMNLIEAGKEGA